MLIALELFTKNRNMKMTIVGTEKTCVLSQLELADVQTDNSVRCTGTELLVSGFYNYHVNNLSQTHCLVGSEVDSVENTQCIGEWTTLLYEYVFR